MRECSAGTLEHRVLALIRTSRPLFQRKRKRDELINCWDELYSAYSRWILLASSSRLSADNGPHMQQTAKALVSQLSAMRVAVQDNHLQQSADLKRLLVNCGRARKRTLLLTWLCQLHGLVDWQEVVWLMGEDCWRDVCLQIDDLLRFHATSLVFGDLVHLTAHQVAKHLLLAIVEGAFGQLQADDRRRPMNQKLLNLLFSRTSNCFSLASVEFVLKNCLGTAVNNTLRDTSAHAQLNRLRGFARSNLGKLLRSSKLAMDQPRVHKLLEVYAKSLDPRDVIQIIREVALDTSSETTLLLPDVVRRFIHCAASFSEKFVEGMFGLAHELAVHGLTQMDRGLFFKSLHLASSLDGQQISGTSWYSVWFLDHFAPIDGNERMEQPWMKNSYESHLKCAEFSCQGETGCKLLANKRLLLFLCSCLSEPAQPPFGQRERYMLSVHLNVIKMHQSLFPDLINDCVARIHFVINQLSDKTEAPEVLGETPTSSRSSVTGCSTDDQKEQDTLLLHELVRVFKSSRRVPARFNHLAMFESSRWTERIKPLLLRCDSFGSLGRRDDSPADKLSPHGFAQLQVGLVHELVKSNHLTKKEYEVFLEDVEQWINRKRLREKNRAGGSCLNQTLSHMKSLCKSFHLQERTASFDSRLWEELHTQLVVLNDSLSRGDPHAISCIWEFQRELCQTSGVKNLRGFLVFQQQMLRIIFDGLSMETVEPTLCVKAAWVDSRNKLFDCAVSMGMLASLRHISDIDGEDSTLRVLFSRLAWECVQKYAEPTCCNRQTCTHQLNFWRRLVASACLVHALSSDNTASDPNRIEFIHKLPQGLTDMLQWATLRFQQSDCELLPFDSVGVNSDDSTLWSHFFQDAFRLSWVISCSLCSASGHTEDAFKSWLHHEITFTGRKQSSFATLDCQMRTIRSWFLNPQGCLQNGRFVHQAKQLFCWGVETTLDQVLTGCQNVDDGILLLLERVLHMVLDQHETSPEEPSLLGWMCAKARDILAQHSQLEVAVLRKVGDFCVMVLGMLIQQKGQQPVRLDERMLVDLVTALSKCGLDHTPWPVQWIRVLFELIGSTSSQLIADVDKMVHLSVELIASWSLGLPTLQHWSATTNSPSDLLNLLESTREAMTIVDEQWVRNAYPTSWSQSCRKRDPLFSGKMVASTRLIHLQLRVMSCMLSWSVLKKELRAQSQPLRAKCRTVSAALIDSYKDKSALGALMVKECFEFWLEIVNKTESVSQFAVELFLINTIAECCYRPQMTALTSKRLFQLVQQHSSDPEAWFLLLFVEFSIFSSKPQHEFNGILVHNGSLWLHQSAVMCWKLHSILQQPDSTPATKNWLSMARIVLNSSRLELILERLMERMLSFAREKQVFFLDDSTPRQLQQAMPSLAEQIQHVPVLCCSDI